MKEYISLAIWVVLIGVTFAVLWRTGQLVRLSNYWNETVEELKKCNWPSVDELKGSTVLVIVTIFSLGIYTIGVDFILTQFVQLIIKL